MTNWCVITAGPRAGKSSTIRELSSRGYRTAPEAARILFDQAISEGRDPDDVRSDDDFHKQVENIDRRIESNILDDETVFLDRSLADNIAYREQFGNDSGKEIANLRAVCKGRYDIVFLLDRLPMEEDDVRTEDDDEARETHETLRRIYEDLGYDVVDIPVMSVEKRADFIELHQKVY